MNELSDKERPRKLEEIFREGMESAEMAPSEQLWNRIEHELDLKETIYYKKRMSWYQMVAAACVTLLLCAGGYFMYDLKTTHKPETITQQTYNPAGVQNSGTGSIARSKNAPGPAVADNPHEVENNSITGSAPTPTITKGKLAEEMDSRALAAAGNPRKTVAVTSQKRNTYRLKTKTGMPAGNNNTIQEEITGFTPEAQVAAISNKLVTTQPIPTEAASETGLADMDLLATKTSAFASKLILPDTLKSVVLALPGLAALTTASDTDQKKANRWTIAGRYAPHYFNQNIALTESKSNFQGISAADNNNFSALSANAATPSSYAQAMSEFDKNTEAQFSYNAGVQAAYQLNKHWALETGIDYAQNMARTTTSYIIKNQVSPATRLFFNNATTHNKSFAIPESVSLPTTALVASITSHGDITNAQIIKTPSFETQYRYRLMGIPVKLNFKTKEKKSFYYASVGVLNNLLMQAHILTDSPKVPDLKYAPKDSPFRNWQVAALASVGKGFRFGKGFNVQAGIEAAQYLTTLAAHPEYLPGGKGKPYTIGLALSSGYTFGAK